MCICLIELSLHRIKKFSVSFKVFKFAYQEFRSGCFIHGLKNFAQDPGFLQSIGVNQIFFSARAGTINVDCRVDSFLSNFSIQMQFHVAGTFEFLIDYLIHS